MTGQIVQFVRALRAAGVRVSVAEALDACECLRHVDMEDRAEFRLALRASLAKDSRDFEAFDLLFEEYFRWHRPPKKRREPDRPTHRNEGTAPRPGGSQPGRPAPEPRPGRPPQVPAAEKPSVADGLDQSDRSDPTDPANPTDPTHPEGIRLLEALQEGMEDARRRAERQASQRHHDLRHLDLQRRLNPEEARAVAAEVEKLARRLISRESLRLRRARRGKVDLKATIARSARTGGVPFHVAHRRRAIARHKLLVLCDVSGSVWNVAVFLLRLAHRLQSRFSRTRSLVFVDRPVDVTALFERHPFEEALDRLRSHPELNLNAYSDFGNAFYEVCDDFLALLDRDTVVLILGDARTNQFDPMAWALEAIRRHVRRIVWLNPEPRERWDTHDSAMSRYAPFCDAVLPCGNLEQLREAAESILSRR
ncbi:MAG: VWA domain-containing protein [Armatimonadetes bacterium]|nr:VWA domain-containing protein [Armatimonadota bacterium]